MNIEHIEIEITTDKKDEILGKPIGTVEYTVLYVGHQAVKTTRPIYAYRKHYLKAVNQKAHQVLINIWDDMMWINVKPEDVTLNLGLVSG